MQTMAPPEQIPAERFERIDERFDRVDERLVEVDRRITETAKETDRRLKEVDRRITEVDRRITEGKEETAHRFDRIERDLRELKVGLASVQTTLNRGWIGLALGFLTLLGMAFAKGG